MEVVVVVAVLHRDFAAGFSTNHLRQLPTYSLLGWACSLSLIGHVTTRRWSSVQPRASISQPPENNIRSLTMNILKHRRERPAQEAGSSAVDPKATSGRMKGLQRLLGRKGEEAQSDSGYVASSGSGSSHARDKLSGNSLVGPVSHGLVAPHEGTPKPESLWQCAYDTLAKEKKLLVEDYDKLLSKATQETGTHHLQAWLYGRILTSSQVPHRMMGHPQRRHTTTMGNLTKSS